MPAGLTIDFNPGDDLYVNFVGDGNQIIASGQVSVVQQIRVVAPMGHPSYPYDQTTYHKATYDITKVLASEASVNTRKGYGDPSYTGDFKLDPNAELRNLNFSDYVFRGGGFVGNVPVVTGDQSGTARLQLTSGGSGSPRLLTLSLLDMGSPTEFDYDVTIGAFLPDSADPNLSVSLGSLTWTSRWTSIEPRLEVPQGQQTNHAKDPVATVWFDGDSTTPEYANWCLTTVSGGTYSTPTNAMARICLALHGEPLYVSGNYAAWRYFASSEYASAIPSPTFPITDSRPRFWLVTVYGTSSW